MRLKGISLFITGSNSKLLSGEFIKELSGRYVAFNIRSFVYKELKEYAKKLGKDISISEYLIYGGFPKILEFNDKAGVLCYLNELDASIVAYSVVELKARQRELGAFDSIDNSRQKILISNDEIDFSTSTVRHIRLSEFLGLEHL